MSRHRMTDEQAWAIINAPDDVNAQQLADSLGLTYSAVHSRRWQLRKHGWSCRVSWEPCQECGKPLIRPTSRKRYHDECRPEALRRLNASYESEREYNVQQLAARDRHRDEHYERAQASTLPHATNHHRRYTPEDDALLLEMSKTMTHEEIALEVGRTRAAVQTRLRIVRKRDTKKGTQRRMGSRNAARR